MKRYGRKLFLVLALGLLLCTACSSSEPQPVTETYTATIDEREMYGSQLFVYGTQVIQTAMGLDTGDCTYYAYDMVTEQREEIGHIPYFAMQARHQTVLDNALYFYVGVNDIENMVMKNVLYRIDLGSMKMEAISENEYPRHMIPLVSWKDEIWALEGEASASGKAVIFIEVLNDDGEVKRRIDMEEIAGEDRTILGFAEDGGYLYTIERPTVGPYVYWCQYSEDMQRLQDIEISALMEEYNITNCSTFYVFGDYFWLSNSSIHSMLCKVENGTVEALMGSRGLEYAVNYYDTEPYEYLCQKETDKVYKLNKETGEIETLEMDFGNEETGIQIVLRGQDALLMTRINWSNVEEQLKYLYLFPNP